MQHRLSLLAVLSLALPLAAGCTSTSSNYSVVKKETTVSKLSVCHGFDCRNRTTLALSAGDAGRFGPESG